MILAALMAALATYLVISPVPSTVRFATAPSRLRPKIPAAITVALLVGLSSLLLLGWPVGMIVGLVAAPLAARAVGRLESREARRRRESIERDLPLSLDLTVAALESGQAPAAALRLVGQAVGGPLGDDLTGIASRLDMGSDPEVLWADAAQQRELAPLSRAFARAARSGASTTRVLRRAGVEMRQQRRAAAQEKARSVGVKTAAPLGLCFLPAFVLIGIVPTIISAFQGISW